MMIPSHNVFDQRDQIIHGDQFNIVGDYNLAAAKDPSAAIDVLRQLIEELNRARSEEVIPARVAVSARQAVENAVLEAEESEPDKQSIVDYLTTAKQTIEVAAGTAGLITAVSQAIQLVANVF